VHLPRSDFLHIRAAEGWLELGNWHHANDELENISPALKSHPVVLQIRCDIYKAAKKWDYVAEVARHLADRFPTQWRYPYLLACCYAQLGDFTQSKIWFQQAMGLCEKTVQRKAAIDDDLKPLWDSMSGTMWRRE
jgi:tetratricopeptide (TPR) repeat protein